MNDHETTIDAADHRRALAVMSHFLAEDFAGVSAVLKETNSTGRRVQLLLAVLNSTAQILPELRTPLGIQMIRQQLMYAATTEGTER